MNLKKSDYYKKNFFFYRSRNLNQLETIKTFSEIFKKYT